MRRRALAAREILNAHSGFGNFNDGGDFGSAVGSRPDV
jgi:hypothetical protein